MYQAPRMKSFLPLIVILLLLGWGGLFILLNMTQPTIWPRWLFFFLIVVGCTGLALPLAVTFNRRFLSDPPPEPKVMVRQSLWFGIYVALMVWLNFGQVVSFGFAIMFLIGFAGLEVFLRVRERSRWRRP